MPDIVVMFFLLGMVAGLVRSELKIPKEAYDVLSLLLMLTIGLKGGMALHGNLSYSLAFNLAGIVVLSACIPLILFPILRHVVGLSYVNSGSLAAHYGSVSAGTFAVALAYAESNQLALGSEVTLYLVFMELPAIIVGIALYKRFSRQPGAKASSNLWKETLTNRSVILLVGGVIIGFMYGPLNGSTVTDLFTGAFKGVLALFLLEMGLTAAAPLQRMQFSQWRLLVFAIIAPVCLSLLGITTGLLLGLETGSILILASLTASASYIAAPAAIKNSIPEADIGLAMLVSLGITFPFNVIIGIGFYHWMIGLVAG